MECVGSLKFKGGTVYYSMKKLLFIINPVAGKRHSRLAMFEVVKVFCKAGYSVTTAVTLHRNHAKEMAAKAGEEGFELVVCIGGDGTLNEVLSGLMSAGNPLPIGYIPAGSTNDFARSMGLSPNPAKAAENICRRQSSFIDLGSFNGGERFFSYIASFGAFTEASFAAPQAAKNNIGQLAYLMEGLKELGKIQAHTVKIVADGKEYRGRYIFGAISNTRSVAGIVKLRDRAVDFSDGLFEVTLIKNPVDPIDLTNLFIGISRGDFDNNMFDYFHASRIEVTMSRKVPWTLDGEEAHSDGHIVLENLHGAVEIYK